MKERKGLRSFSLYQKFALTIVLLGLLPMAVLPTFIANKMIRDYSLALKGQYEQAAGYVASSIESMLDSYNTISKMPYFYNFDSHGAQSSYLSFDHFRQILFGEGYEPDTMEEERKRDMGQFLQYIQSVDSYISGVHVIAQDGEGEKQSFHYSVYNTFFLDPELFETDVAYENLDKSAKKLILAPPHTTAYFYGTPKMVFTLARNYFDLRGPVGDTPYVGTIFIDVDLKRLEGIFRSVAFTGNEAFYVVNENNDCFYSNLEEWTGQNAEAELAGLGEREDRFVIRTPENAYGLSVIVSLDARTAFGDIRRMQQMMYFFVALSVLALLAGSFYFSRRLTSPMHEMMDQMSLIETGNFDIELAIRSKDEIGVLSKRFNQMSSALKTYINKSYVAQIKQSEAEIAPEMIEALSEQIHYLIGPVQDMVPLEKEIDIVGKYVYLLNCRVGGKIQLTVNTPGGSKIQIPRLTLQPIVENAYVHGIKPKKGKGCIMIETAIHEGKLEITVMDNGVGMDEEAVAGIMRLFESGEPGVKNEYNWQSIGLKNVHDRIRFLYGEEFGIRITSTPAVGTMVRILLPLQKMMEKDRA